MTEWTTPATVSFDPSYGAADATATNLGSLMSAVSSVVRGHPGQNVAFSLTDKATGAKVGLKEIAGGGSYLVAPSAPARAPG
jgi:hypothetical protein